MKTNKLIKILETYRNDDYSIKEFYIFTNGDIKIELENKKETLKLDFTKKNELGDKNEK